MKRNSFLVDGLSCPACVQSVSSLLKSWPAVHSVEIGPRGLVTIESDTVDLAALRSAIETLGYLTAAEGRA